MNIKPGDLFEWADKYSKDCVVQHLYSLTMKKFIPCNELCLCVKIEDDVIYWLSSEGLSHAHMNTIGGIYPRPLEEFQGSKYE